MYIQYRGKNGLLEVYESIVEQEHDKNTDHKTNLNLTI